MQTTAHALHSIPSLYSGAYANKIALKRLDKSLLETEIYLAELDLELTKGLAYGWREDAGTRFNEIRANIPTALDKIQTSIRTFFKELTTSEGNALPDWVYKSTGGALEEVLLSLEKRMKEEDGVFQSAVLQVLRNFVKNYRNRISEAAKKVGQPEAGTAEPTPTPAPEGAAKFNEFFEL